MRMLSGDDFVVFQQYGAPVHRARDTVAFLERERREKRVVIYVHVPCTGHNSSTNSDNFEPICHDN